VINVGAANRKRNEGKESARGRRVARDPRGGRRRHRAWRPGVALLRCLNGSEAVKGANEDEQIGRGYYQARVEYPAKHLAMNGGYEGSVIVQEIQEAQRQRRFQRRKAASMKTSSKPAWWTRRRSPAARCRTRHPSRPVADDDVLITEIPEKEKPAPMGGGHGGGGMGGMDY